MTKKQLTTFFLHISIWLLFLSIPMLMLPDSKEIGIDPMAIRIPMLISFLFYAILFYCNYYVLIPQVWMRYGGGFYLVTISAAIFLIAGIQWGIREVFIIEHHIHLNRFHSSFKRMGFFVLLISNSFIWTLSSGFWILKKWRNSEERLRESEHKRTEAELAQLKKQLNPHFLFNTLNGIYALTLTQDPEAPNAVMKLSKLLSYVLNDARLDHVSLQQDIDHLQHFIELNKMRMTTNMALNCSIEGELKSYQIAPLLLLPFVENAFKYGVSNVAYSPIDISIKLEKGQLTFHCTNIVQHTDTHTIQSSGLGISNTRRRLELMYPDRHHLSISQTEDQYIVQLHIDLKQPKRNLDRQNYLLHEAT